MFKNKLPSAVIAIALTVAMLFSVAIPTFAYTASVGSVAEDVNGEVIVGQDVDQGKQTEYSDDIAVEDIEISEDCDVYATLPDSGIVVTVPKVQILDGKSAATNVGVYTVAVRGDISATTVINVEPQDEMEDRYGVNFEMSSAGKDNIPTDIDQAKTEFTYADGVRPNTPAITTGTITARNMTAGIWNGNFMFNISAGIKDETTYYTVEEIEADPTMFMIGATNPEYVVADFNDDFTEVVITRNGANSDGVMAALIDMDTAEFTSPMMLHADTLKNAIVKAGVVNIGMGAFFGDLTRANICNLEYGLESISLPNTLTSIDPFAFAASGIEKIDFPNSLTTIGDYAFVYSQLKSVHLPDSVVKIGLSCFEEAVFIEKVHLGNVTDLTNGYEFCNCYSLKTITANNEVVIPGEAIRGTQIYSNNITYQHDLTPAIEELVVSSNGLVSVTYSTNGYVIPYKIEREILQNGSVIFYWLNERQELDGNRILKGYLKENTVFTPSRSIYSIDGLVCEANVSIYLYNNVKDFGDKYSVTNLMSNNSTALPLAENLTIYGIAGTYVEEFANEQGHTFIDISGEITS